MLRQFLLGKIHRCAVTRADLDYVGSITIDPLLIEAEAIKFAIEPSVARERFGTRRIGLLHAPDTARQQGRVGWGTLPEELPIDNRPLGVLGQEQRVAELHFGASLLAHNHPHIRFIEAEDLLFIGHELAFENTLAGLLASLG